MRETQLVIKASIEAAYWCAKHPGWDRICDINPDKLYKTWAETSQSVRRVWEFDPVKWAESGAKEYTYRVGYITHERKFSYKQPDEPHMQVFKTNET